MLLLGKSTAEAPHPSYLRLEETGEALGFNGEGGGPIPDGLVRWASTPERSSDLFFRSG